MCILCVTVEEHLRDIRCVTALGFRQMLWTTEEFDVVLGLVKSPITKQDTAHT